MESLQMHALKWLFSGIPPMTLKWLFFARKYSYTEFIGFESTTLEKNPNVNQEMQVQGKKLRYISNFRVKKMKSSNFFLSS